MSECGHEWRLLKEEPIIEFDNPEEMELGRVDWLAGARFAGWRRRWYCVFCRTVEWLEERIA